MTPSGRSLLALAASLLVTGPAGAVARRPVDIGQPLPAFEATALSGEAFSLESATREHKAVVVLLTSTVSRTGWGPTARRKRFWWTRRAGCATGAG